MKAKEKREAFLRGDLTYESDVNKWLTKIGETDERCRKEVIEQCKVDVEARAYYVRRYHEEFA